MTENKNKTSKNKAWELVNFCEFDKFAIKSYCAVHNVDESLNLGDITKVDETQLKPFNMICGGSPCQDFSIAGKGKGSVWTCKHCGHTYNPLTVHWSERDACPECGSKDIEKTRSSLLVEYLRVIRANKPNFGIYENVKNIVGKKFKDTTFKLFTQELEEYGYNVYWKVLNAKNYGIPQNRERVYLIFIKKELDNGKFNFPEPFNNGIRLKDILDNVVDDKFYLNDDQVKRIKTSTYNQNKTRIQNDNCCQTLCARDFKDPKCVQVGQLYGTEREKNPQAGRVYDPNYISPTMDTCSGGNRMPKVAIPQATKKGFIECEVGGVADLSYPDSKTRRGRVQDSGNTSPTITATETGICKIESPIRIRKLTPKECWILMGFSDNDFAKAEQVVSNSQLYKQAGNSIVVDVLYYIFVELYKAMPYLFDDLKLSSFFSGIGAFEVALDRLYQGINNGFKR
jgi:DNA (cytosine-5)-methyltransferase 1